jgi:dsDNA-specific endonuclease/ATPase MutS2
MKFNYDIQIDLHGWKVEDAVNQVRAICFGRRGRGVMVIHGKGDGKLRKAIRDYLATNKSIKGYEFGEVWNIPGGDGVTIIYT